MSQPDKRRKKPMTTQITSATSGKQYHLTINDETGLATSCTCGDCTYRKPHNCKHMKSFNQARRDAERTAYINFELSLGIFN